LHGKKNSTMAGLQVEDAELSWSKPVPWPAHVSYYSALKHN
jgi:hypothetical protein